jgi:alkanesulfonate monooxygenase SsuD/methylene tetrahydromethanopterin reductase-like flavin-dependent oxidoreductase (luciferase family)
MDPNTSQDDHNRRPQRGYGIEASLAHDIVRELAPAAERAGYRTFWVNDEAAGDGLAALHAAAAVTTLIGSSLRCRTQYRSWVEPLATRPDGYQAPP